MNQLSYSSHYASLLYLWPLVSVNVVSPCYTFMCSGWLRHDRTLASYWCYFPNLWSQHELFTLTVDGWVWEHVLREWLHTCSYISIAFRPDVSLSHYCNLWPSETAHCLPQPFILLFCSSYSSNLKIEATYFSETSVNFRRTNIPEDEAVHNHYC
jgi:hypothetical protein